MELENTLKIIMIKEFGTVQKFADSAGIKYTTLLSILKRGVGTAGLDNVIKMCKTLGISVDELARGRIVATERHDTEKKDVAEMLREIVYLIETDKEVLFESLPMTEYEADTARKTIAYMIELMRIDRNRRKNDEGGDKNDG